MLHRVTREKGYSLYQQSIFLTNLAGLPTHNSPAGTSLVTTLPAPIIAFSPIVMPHNTVHPAPMKYCIRHQLLAINTEKSSWLGIVIV